MAKGKKSASKAPAPKDKQGTTGKSSLRIRAFGDAADGFGKEIAPLGPRTGALARRVGQHLLTVAEGSVFGLEKVANWMQRRVAEKLQGAPEEQIVPPDPRIVVPAIQALIYSMHDESIREMFATLLASNINAHLKGRTHPAFVEMIKELTPIDARLLALLHSQSQVMFRGRLRTAKKWRDYGDLAFSFALDDAHPIAIARSVDNLCRLRLTELRTTETPRLSRLKGIEEIEGQLRDALGRTLSDFKTDPVALEKDEMDETTTVEIVKLGIFVTAFGSAFCQTCFDERHPNS
jgi:hypothetical protein